MPILCIGGAVEKAKVWFRHLLQHIASTTTQWCDLRRWRGGWEWPTLALLAIRYIVCCHCTSCAAVECRRKPNCDYIQALSKHYRWFLLIDSATKIRMVIPCIQNNGYWERDKYVYPVMRACITCQECTHMFMQSKRFMSGWLMQTRYILNGLYHVDVDSLRHAKKTHICLCRKPDVKDGYNLLLCLPQLDILPFHGSRVELNWW